ncbi:MAG: helix-turn-helix transcriptional regulator [Lachnospiraceae bacterium]|nr:helix-turn-helix transcriptional regulator [Lachnospiraceae bacterium]
MVAERLVSARDSVGMTQCRLAEETGIYQADISKIERGLANPSLLTLQRLADGMDMEIVIEFVPKRK